MLASRSSTQPVLAGVSERAALEAFGGIYEVADIASRLSRQEVLERALDLMTEA